jgi:hypothetical protein
MRLLIVTFLSSNDYFQAGKTPHFRETRTKGKNMLKNRINIGFFAQSAFAK